MIIDIPLPISSKYHSGRQNCLPLWCFILIYFSNSRKKYRQNKNSVLSFLMLMEWGYL